MKRQAGNRSELECFGGNGDNTLLNGFIEKCFHSKSVQFNQGNYITLVYIFLIIIAVSFKSLSTGSYLNYSVEYFLGLKMKFHYWVRAWVMSHPDSPVIVTHGLSRVSMFDTSTDTSYIIMRWRNTVNTFSIVCGCSFKDLEHGP